MDKFDAGNLDVLQNIEFAIIRGIAPTGRSSTSM